MAGWGARITVVRRSTARPCAVRPPPLPPPYHVALVYRSTGSSSMLLVLSYTDTHCTIMVLYTTHIRTAVYHALSSYTATATTSTNLLIIIR